MLYTCDNSGIPVWVIHDLYAPNMPTTPDEEETPEDEIKIYTTIRSVRAAIAEHMNGMIHDMRHEGDTSDLFNDLDYFSEDYLNSMPFVSSSSDLQQYDVINLFIGIGGTIIYRAYVDSVI
jgi:hypothetical protein